MPATRLSAAVGIAVLAFAGAASAGECPAPLASARRLVLVTAATMDTVTARLQRFERAAPDEPWRALGPGEPAVVGKSGLAWSRFFRALARRGEPIKVEGDRRTPAGIYRLGRSFGIEASTRPGYLHVKDDTVCVDDAASPAYNTITVRASIGPKVHAETMSRAPSTYRRGIVIDYPTDARARAGSCIFVHVWRNSSSGTAGCVALPQQRVEALQDFTASPDTAIAILPRDALARLPGCLPAATP